MHLVFYISSIVELEDFNKVKITYMILLSFLNVQPDSQLSLDFGSPLHSLEQAED